MLLEKKGIQRKQDGAWNVAWQKALWCCSNKSLSRVGPWRLLRWGGVVGNFEHLHGPPGWAGRHLSLDHAQSIHTFVSPRGYFRRYSMSSLFFVLFILGDPGGSDHPGQPPAGGLWKCQDCEKWQLIEICKTQSSFQLSPQNRPFLLMLDMKIAT